MKTINSLAIAFILIISLFGIGGCFFQQDASEVALEVAGGYEKETTKKEDKKEEVGVPELIAKFITIPKSVKTTKLSDSEDDSDPNKATLGIKPEPSTDAVLDKFKTSLEADGYAVKMHSSTTNIDGTTYETKVLDGEKEIEDGRLNVRIQGSIEHKGEDSVEKKMFMMLSVSYY